MPTRLEHDSLGDVAVPSERLWGAQTQRSLEHFRISTERMPPELIRALARIKRAAALANASLGVIGADIAHAIVLAAEEIIGGGHADDRP